MSLRFEYIVGVCSKNANLGESTSHRGDDQDLDSYEFLRQHGMCINEQDEFGDTWLMRLCRDPEKHPESIEFLIDSGAGISCMNHAGYSALGIVCCSKGCSHMIEVLLDHGMDINGLENGMTYPLIAAINDNWETMEKLLTLGFSNFKVVHPESGETLMQMLDRRGMNNKNDQSLVRTRNFLAKLCFS